MPRHNFHCTPSGEVEVNGKKKGAELKQGKTGEDDLVKVGLTVYNKQGRTKKTLGGEGYTNAWFSAAARDAGYYELGEGDYLKYRVSLEIKGAEVGKTILLATPVFDDITIFYSEGVRIVSYSEE